MFASEGQRRGLHAMRSSAGRLDTAIAMASVSLRDKPGDQALVHRAALPVGHAQLLVAPRPLLLQ